MGDSVVELVVSGWRQPDRTAAPPYADLRRLKVGLTGDALEIDVSLDGAVPSAHAGWTWLELGCPASARYAPRVVGVLTGSYGSQPQISAGKAYVVRGREGDRGAGFVADRLAPVPMEIRGAEVRMRLPAGTLKSLGLGKLWTAVRAEANSSAVAPEVFVRTFHLPSSVRYGQTELVGPSDELEVWIEGASGSRVSPVGGWHPPLPALSQ